MRNKDFACFILTHGRAEKVYTYKTLIEQGYTGKIFLLVDNEDKQQELYKKIYGDKVIIFDKQKAIDITDSCDVLENRRTIIYVRNYSFEVAKQLNIKYFVQLDDDYTTFDFAICNQKYIAHKKIKNLDKIFDLMIDYLAKTKITTIAFAQGGDFIGGENSGTVKKHLNKKLIRKAMNSFFCSTDKQFKFQGRINEDVNTYVNLGSKGYIFLSLPNIRLEQKETQSNSGGMTETYLDVGTYIKSIYSVIINPSCVKVSNMASSNSRIHHKISWKHAVPLILDEKFKKG